MKDNNIRQFIFPKIYYEDVNIFESVRIMLTDLMPDKALSPKFKTDILEYYNDKFLPVFIKPRSIILTRCKVGDYSVEPDRYDIDNDDINNYVNSTYIPKYKDIVFLFNLISLSTFRKTKYNTDITDVGNCILTTDGGVKIFLSIGPIKLSWYITDPKYITITNPEEFYSKVRVDIKALYNKLIKIESSLDQSIFTKESILYKISKKS